MTFIGDIGEEDSGRAAIRAAYRADETACVRNLLQEAAFDPEARRRVEEAARGLIETMRGHDIGMGGLDDFLGEYRLSTREGVTIMCLAEALLRVPDADTADALIRDKILDADWESHIGGSDSLFVNASTWALMLTGKIIRLDGGPGDVGSFLQNLMAKSGEPVIRAALVHAMKILGGQFVMGRTIEEALARMTEDDCAPYRFSFDMLGEAARTAADAERYFRAYEKAVAAVGRASGGKGVIDGPGISVKLSALHPRYEPAQAERIAKELLPRLKALALMARDGDIPLCIDAEEAHRLEPSLDVLDALFRDPELRGWEGFGLAVQAYQKRAAPLIDWLVERARREGRRLMVRLVKGAYWDSEIKRAQEQGLDGYPMFTRKMNTDVSYLACARKLLAARRWIYPQFATHNAHSVAAVREMAGGTADYEFQRLYGMGEDLYDQIVGSDEWNVPVRVYAPVGSHKELLSYLVRRLLENGANTSFIHRVVDDKESVEALGADPVERVSALAAIPHPDIPLPPDLYGAERRNAEGVDLSDRNVLSALRGSLAAAGPTWRASPFADDIGGRRESAVYEPADRRQTVGHVVWASARDVERAVGRASAAAPAWAMEPVETRAQCLERAAGLFEDAMSELMALAIREGGKTIPDAVAEVREAVDFCRYYAMQARRLFAAPQTLPGPTGESNVLRYRGRGVIACISPWNFPLAIFSGQIAAALVAGNAVIAKPAEQTPLIAARAVELFRQAGVPEEVLQVLPGDGPNVGAPLVADARIQGVLFTGSVETARSINRVLANKDGPIVPLIAETGGLNAMIVDSSALPEQVVDDVVTSAFRSAGQRCSALRVLFLQKDIAETVNTMLAGAVAALRVGAPKLLRTDVGPVIDAAALQALDAHAERMGREGTLLAEGELNAECAHGTFFAPRAYRIERLGQLPGEVFGPILHVIEYDAERLDDVVAAVNKTGYGLTFGIHSRIDKTVRRIQAPIRAGNVYVNRSMIGAVVGVQPFGGEGLSGTGPKAGGPNYLTRLVTEQAVSVNTAAAGGNAALLSLRDDA
ncbi:MAG: bifunctional proline dehydrogenase/L-glutamate gamma-semialdehyde dehydrogenase PutA [Rhodospirillales bacterium]